MLSKWTTISKELKSDLKIFRYFEFVRVNSAGHKKGSFTVLQSNNWVNIIPITKKGQFVFVKQYRHGTNTIELEIPGGLIENNEIPGSAAKRECIEETGYSSENPLEFLGEIYPNPAFLSNRCYTFIWENCQLNHQQNLDVYEEIEIITLSFDQVKSKIKKGQFRHGIILNALYMYLNKKAHKWVE